MDKIVVLFHGGLGNQIYQYCFYRWLQNRYYKKKIMADISEYKIFDCHQGFELFRIFPKINIDIAGNWDLLKINGEIPRFYCGYGKHFIEKKIRAPLNKKIFKTNRANLFEEENSGEMENIIYAVENGKKYFNGYWADKHFFLDNEEFLLKELRFKELTDKKNIEYKKMIDSSISISMHIRRGDYVTGGWPLVGIDYYKKAVQIIYKQIKNPKFFLFSDDKNYIKNEFEWLKNKVIVDSNMGADSYMDMQLMSYCKHNILANSTFSTWGALLNPNSNKMVIYPKQNNCDRTMLDNWIMLGL